MNDEFGGVVVSPPAPPAPERDEFGGIVIRQPSNSPVVRDQFGGIQIGTPTPPPDPAAIARGLRVLDTQLAPQLSNTPAPAAPPLLRDPNADLAARREQMRLMRSVSGLPEEPLRDAQEMSAAQHAYGRFMQSFYGGLAAIPEAASVLAAKPAAFMESIVPLEGGNIRRPEENLLYQGGQALRDAIAKERPIDPNRPKSFLADTLPSGAGSMAAFIGTGGGLKALGLTKTAGQVALGVAAAGAGISGAESYREAVAAGADDDAAFTVFAGNAVLGTTEAVPIAGWLNRLNKASGNKLKHAIIEGSEELVQEVFQQFGGNLIARETYDPKRKLSEGLIEGGAAGFTLGSLMSLVVSAIGGRVARKTQPGTDAPTIPKGEPNASTQQSSVAETRGDQAQSIPPPVVGSPGQVQVPPGARAPGSDAAAQAAQAPVAPPGERLVTIQRADGTTYTAAVNDKAYTHPTRGQVPSVARLDERGQWTHGMLGVDETILPSHSTAKPSEPGTAAGAEIPTARVPSDKLPPSPVTISKPQPKGGVVSEVKEEGQGQEVLKPTAPVTAAQSGQKPLTPARFEREYAQHIDLRARGGDVVAKREKILREGFKKGSNVNALPPTRGLEPNNVIERNFQPKKGDLVLLAPKEAWKSGPNGMEIKDGWKPKPDEAIIIDRDNPDMYQEYLRAKNEASPTAPAVATGAAQKMAKEAWQLTKEQFVDSEMDPTIKGSDVLPTHDWMREKLGGSISLGDRFGLATTKTFRHAELVALAIRQGKQVPESVLRDYPEFTAVEKPAETPPMQIIGKGDWVEYTDSYGKTQQGKVDEAWTTAAIVPTRAGVKTRVIRHEYSIVDANGKPMVSPATGTPLKKISAPATVPETKTLDQLKSEEERIYNEKPKTLPKSKEGDLAARSQHDKEMAAWRVRYAAAVKATAAAESTGNPKLDRKLALQERQDKLILMKPDGITVQDNREVSRLLQSTIDGGYPSEAQFDYADRILGEYENRLKNKPETKAPVAETTPAKTDTEPPTLFEKQRALQKAGWAVSTDGRVWMQPVTEKRFTDVDKAYEAMQSKPVKDLNAIPATDEALAATSEEDFNAMLDQAAADVAAEAPKPAEKPKAKLFKAGQRVILPDGRRATVAADQTQWRETLRVFPDVAGDTEVTEESIPFNEATRLEPEYKPINKPSGASLKNPTTQADKPKTPTQNLSDAARAMKEAGDELAKGLNDLFGGGTRMLSGIPEFSEENYQKAKPHFDKAWEKAKSGGNSFMDFLRDMLKRFGNALRPYLQRWHKDVTAESKAKPTTAKPESKLDPKIVEIIESRETGQQKAVKIRALATERNLTVKQMQEAIEAEIVKMADAVAREPGIEPRQKFDRMVEIYTNQPTLSARTSTSIEDQAYSTPIPMSYAMLHAIDVTPQTGSYDSTAGNGALMIGGSFRDSQANEINPERAQALRELGIHTVTENDATKYVPYAKFPAVRVNPPFGSIDTVVYGGYGIKKLEHIISLKALEAMTDDGVGMMILGAKREEGEGGHGAQWVFENYIYGHYNVVGNFEVSGDLYGKQGAKWPVRIIVVAGRRQLPVKADLAPKTVERKNTWDEVWTEAERIRNEIETRRAAVVPGAPPGIPVPADQAPQPAPKPGRVPAPTIRTPAPPAGGVGRPGQAGGKPSTTPVSPGGSTGFPPTRPSDEPTNAELPDVQPDGGRKPATPVEGGVSGRKGTPANAPAAVPIPGGEAGSGTVPAPTPVKPPPQVAATEFQVRYRPGSEAPPFETNTPTNISEGEQMALDNLKARVGSIDEYVANALNMTADEVRRVMAAEQVDGAALAIDQVERGDALIIGDETGIGKGRQAAALIRYAMLHDMVPVFFTLKNKLFSDMYGDLLDINTQIKPLVMGDEAMANIVDQHGNVVHRALSGQRLRDAMAEVRDKGMKGAGYDAIFATYSQVNNRNERQQFLEGLASEPMLVIMDESHSAAGDAETSMQAAFFSGGNVRRKVDGHPVLIAVPGILNMPGTSSGRGGVLYLSATYAKNPENMSVYFRTALRRGAQSFRQIVDAMKRGGVAMQQVVSEALAMSGQYLRRERDFTGIRFDMKQVEVADKDALIEQVDDVTDVLKEITIFSRAVQAAADASTAQSDDQRSMTDFASIVHNQIGQLLLAAKADAVIDEAKAAHARGEKPVIALMNTMESFLTHYVLDKNIKPGDEITLRWNELLKYALDRCLRASEENPDGTTTIYQLNPDDLNLGDYYRQIQGLADGITSNFPISPIDYIIQKLNAAGVRTAELTGRHSGIEYTNFEKGTGIYRRFNKANVNTVVNGFNDGTYEGMLLNASGSTGLSAHASVKFSDQRPRHMVIAQAALDIAVMIQTLGRIKRTGMVLLGQHENGDKYGARYTYLSLPLQAELRPAAIAARKMKSLNANTTAAADNAVKIQAEAIYNKYGDQIVSEFLDERPDLQIALDITIDHNQDGSVNVRPDVARKFTGRQALLPDADQEAAYNEILPAYRALVEQLKNTGEYDLEVVVHDDWDGVMTSDSELAPGTNAANIFTAGVRVQQWEIKDSRHIPTGAEIQKEFERKLESRDKALDKWQEIQTRTSNYLGERRTKLESELAAAPDADKPKIQTHLDNLDDMDHRWDDTRRAVEGIMDEAGRLLKISNVDTGEEFDGMLVDVTYPRSVRVALSAFRFKFAVHAPGGVVHLTGADVAANRWTIGRSYNELADLVPRRGAERTTRYVVVGNPFQADNATGGRGKLTRFKARDESIITGRLMPRNWTPAQLANDPRFDLINGQAVIHFLRTFGEVGYRSYVPVEADGRVRITHSRDQTGDFTISVPSSRRTGSDVYLDEALRAITGDFTKQGNRMVVTISRGEVARAADRIMAITSKKFRVIGNEPATLIPQVQQSNQAGGALPPTTRQSVGDVVSEPMSQPAVESVVREFFGGEIPDNVRFVNDPNQPRAVVEMTPGARGQITLNLAKLDSPELVRDTLREELIHSVWDSPAVAEARRTIEGLVSDVDRERQAEEGYNPNETQEEAANERARRIFEDAERANIFVRAWRAIVAAIKKLFRVKLNADETARVAARTLMREAMKNEPTMRGGRAQGADALYQFYSRLTRTVEQSQQGKATGAQWKATIRNSKLGANMDEMALVGVNDLEDGKTYTKQEVLDYLKANEVVVKDVTLGGPTRESLSDDATRTGNALFTKIRKLGQVEIKGRQVFDDEVGWGLIDGDIKPSDLPADMQRDAEQWVKSYKARQGFKEPDPAHFSTYQLPGAKEGSYREVLLTVPRNDRYTIDEQGGEPGMGESSFFVIRNLVTGKTSEPFDNRADAEKLLAEKGKGTTQWHDGHSQYSDIANPIVRLRFNERTTADGKRMLFLEEVQGPNKENQEKMPKLFRFQDGKGMEIALKWALRHAAENGYDSLGYTTGEQQVKRYRDAIVKEVAKVEWSTLGTADTSTGKFVVIPSSEKSVTFSLKSGGDIDVAVDAVGKVIRSQNNKSGVPFIGKMLDEIIGKPMAEKILAEKNGNVAGEGIEVGGEGLRKLYDSDFRNVVNNLPAVKKAGQKVGTSQIETFPTKSWLEFSRQHARAYPEATLGETRDAWDVFKRAGGPDIHSLELTPAIRESVMGGQAMFSLGNEPLRRGAEPTMRDALEGDPNDFPIVNGEEPGADEHVQIAGVDYTILGKEKITPQDLALGAARVRDYFGKELNLPGKPDLSYGKKRGATDTNVIYTITPDGQNHDEAGQKLIEHFTEQVKQQFQPGGDPAYTASLANAIKKNFVLGNWNGVLSESVLNDLVERAASDSSFIGQMLRARTGIQEDVQTVARNAPFFLRRIYAERFGGENVNAVLEKLLTRFKGLLTDQEILDALNGAPALKVALDKITGNRAAEILRRIFEQPFDSQKQVRQKLVKILQDELKVSKAEAAKIGKLFDDAFTTMFNRIAKASLAMIEKAMTARDRQGLGVGRRRGIWQHIVNAVEKGNFDANYVLQRQAASQRWNIPTEAELAKVREMAEEIDRLLQIPAKRLAEIGNNPAELELERVRQRDATSELRVELKRKIESYWSRWTLPLTPRNPRGRANIVSAIYEHTAAVLLLKLGFVTRQGIDVANNALLHIPFRSLGHAIAQHGGFKDNVSNKEFWDDANALFKQSARAQMQALPSALREFKEALKGTAEVKNVDRLLSGIALFERVQMKADELQAAGHTGRAFLLRAYGLVRFSYRFASALDNFQGVPQEWQEIRSQAYRSFRENGMSTGEAKTSADGIVPDMRAAFLEAMPHAKRILEEALADEGKQPTAAQIEAGAWHIVKGMAYHRMSEAGMPADDFEQRNRLMRSTNAWNESMAGVQSVGGVMSTALKAAGEFGKSFPPAGLLLGSFGRFGNAIGTSIDRALTMTPLGMFPAAFGVREEYIDPETGISSKGSPWFRTAEDRATRGVESAVFSTLGALFIMLVLAGYIVVRNRWPRDKEERDKWERNGWQPGTVGIQLGNGQEITVSMKVGPLAPLRPYLAASGSLRDSLNKQAEQQAALNEKAAKLGLTPGKAKSLGLSDIMALAAETSWASIMGGRTASGLIGSITDYGTPNAAKSISAAITPYVPGLPAIQEASRMAGVVLNQQTATVADFLVPLPSSPNAKANVLGDPAGTPHDLQRIVQVLTGGTYPGITEADAGKANAAYTALFGSSYRPPSINPNQGYSIGGDYRPMTATELEAYTVARGQAFKQELSGVNVEGLPENEARKVVQAAYQRANRTALAAVGVSVPASASRLGRGEVSSGAQTLAVGSAPVQGGGVPRLTSRLGPARGTATLRFTRRPSGRLRMTARRGSLRLRKGPTVRRRGSLRLPTSSRTLRLRRPSLRTA